MCNSTIGVAILLLDYSIASICTSICIILSPHACGVHYLGARSNGEGSVGDSWIVQSTWVAPSSSMHVLI